MAQKTPLPAGTDREFMEKTKYQYLTLSDQERGLPQPPHELNPWH